MCELEDGLVRERMKNKRKEKRKIVMIIVRDNSPQHLGGLGDCLRGGGCTSSLFQTVPHATFFIFA